MRRASLTTIAILCAFQFLAACGDPETIYVYESGELDSEMTKERELDEDISLPAPPRDSLPSAPSVDTPTAPTPQAQVRTRTDLDDVEADAICAIRAKAAPGGTFVTDSPLPISSARDVSASLATPNNLRLKFDFAPKHSEFNGRPYRIDTFSTLEIIVPAGPATPKDALVVGSAITVSLHSFSEGGVPCTTVVEPYGGAAEGSIVSTTSKLTITSRTDIQIEGALDIVTEGKTTHLAFRAPITDNVTPPAQICCLKPR